MDKKKYLYILSQRYSGSTLLSFLLGTHPDISTIGERRKFFNKSLKPYETTGLHCSCGKLFQDCDYWNTIKERILSRISEKDLETNFTEFEFCNNRYLNQFFYKIYEKSLLNNIPKSWLPFSKKINRLNKCNQILVEEILKLDDSSVFLDSSKTIKYTLFLSHLEDFDFYIIWLARDPRAQVFSALKYNDWTVEEAARKWMREMDNNERILTEMNANYVMLRYEALCKNPEREITRILNFVGLDSEKFSLDFRERKQHIMGNRNMRLGTDTKIKMRTDWKEKLSKSDIGLIEKLTVDYQKYYSE